MKGIQLFNNIMSVIVIIICICWLYAMWFTDVFIFMEPLYKKMLTGILLLYMFFRGWRLYSSLKNRNLPNE